MASKRSAKTVSAKIPPHNIEAEQAVLASAIIDANVIDELLGTLEPDYFYEPRHKYIYEALVALRRAGKPLDLVTLITRLTDENTLEQSGGYEYVSELVQIIPNAANVEAYSNIIHEKALLRKMISVGASISEMGYNTVEPVEELINSAQAAAYDLGADRLRADAEHITAVLSKTYNKLEQLYETSEGRSDISGVPSLFPDLDKITNGFQPSDLIIVAGRPGMGKTSFGLNVLFNAASKGYSCVFFSLEMSSEQLVNRLISCEKKIGMDKLRTGNLNQDNWRDLGEFSSQLEKFEIYLDDTPQITVNQVRSKCRKLKSKLNGRLDMIFVDYLQIMGFNKNITVREQQISEISRSLKALAKELNVPVMAFAQVNRGVEARADSRPIISDLRESGAIEQDADIIMFLYRDVMHNKDSVYKNIAEVIVAKHRNGSTGTVYLGFDPSFTSFEKRPIDKTYLPKPHTANTGRGSHKNDE